MAQILQLHLADGLDDRGGDQLQLVVDARQMLQRVQQKCRRGPQQGGSLAGDHSAVRQRQSAGHRAALLSFLQAGHHGGTLLRGYAGLLHQQLQLAHHTFVTLAPHPVISGGVVPPHDLVTAGGLTHLIVHDGKARHVDAHIGRGLVRGFPLNPLEHGVENGEYLHIPVIVDGCLTVGLQMERIDHVHIVQIGGSGLIGQVHRMLQGQVPDGEGLIFGIAGADAPLVLVIELAQAGSHLAAARTGGGDHHHGAAGFDIFIAPQSLVGHHMRHIGGISGNGIMPVAFHTQRFQPLDERLGVGLPGVLGDDHAAHIEAQRAEHVDQPQYVIVIGDAQIAPNFAFFNIAGADGHHDLHLVLHGAQHPDLAVRLKARQYPAGVVVVKQLAAELQIQLAAELCAALANMLRLQRQIFVVVKTQFHPHTLPLSKI